MFISQKAKWVSDYDRAVMTKIHNFATNQSPISCSIVTGINTAEPLVPWPTAFESEMAIEKMKGYQSPGTN